MLMLLLTGLAAHAPAHRGGPRSVF
jgi:hypothetical protein